MFSANLSDEQLLRHLNQHPHLKHRIQTLIQVVEDAGGDLTIMVVGATPEDERDCGVEGGG